MFTVATLAIIVTMGFALARALLGPTVYDRILTVNMVGTQTVLLIAVIGFLEGRPDFLDIALLYALINIIATVAAFKFRAYGGLGDARRTPGDEGSS